MERTKVETVYKVNNEIFTDFREADDYAFKLDCIETGIEFFDRSFNNLNLTLENLYLLPPIMKIKTYEGVNFIEEINNEACWEKDCYPKDIGIFIYDETRKRYVLLKDKIRWEENNSEFYIKALKELS